MLERGLGGWYGVVLLVELDNKRRRRRHTFRFASSELSLLAPLIFLYFIISVQLQSVSESLSLSLALSRFFLSIFEFFFSFFGEGEFFLHARCVLRGFASACFPYAWRVGGVLKEGGGSTTRRLLPDGGEDDEDDGLAEAMTRKMNHCERSLRLSSTGNSCDSWLWWSWNSRHTPVSPNSGSS